LADIDLVFVLCKRAVVLVRLVLVLVIVRKLKVKLQSW